jgi:hypothetical protein
MHSRGACLPRPRQRKHGGQAGQTTGPVWVWGVEEGGRGRFKLPERAGGGGGDFRRQTDEIGGDDDGSHAGSSSASALAHRGWRTATDVVPAGAGHPGWDRAA